MAEPAKPAPRKKGGKRRERREVRTGVAHVQATFNNTIVTLTDKMGNVVSWSSAGSAAAQASMPARSPRRRCGTSRTTTPSLRGLTEVIARRAGSTCRIRA